MIGNTKRVITFQFKIKSLILLAFLLPIFCFSQDVSSKGTQKAHLKKPITATFTFPDVEFEDMPVISNVLRVENNNAKTYHFTIRLNLPEGWKSVNNPNKVYSLSPDNSLFIPVRIITNNKLAKGGTKYNINAFIATSEGRQMALASFRAGRPKISDWQLDVLPRSRIYFLNNQNEVPFQIKLSNNGDEEEELLLSMKKIGLNFMIAHDDGGVLKKNYQEYLLPSDSDTLLEYRAFVQEPKRNHQRIDSYGYLPNAFAQEKHFGLYLNASEVRAKPGNFLSKNKTVDFVKLGNSISFVKLSDATLINRHGSAIIPLTMAANVYNVLGEQPVLNLVFNGNTQLNDKSALNYFLQSGFTYYKLGKQTQTNTAGVLGYTHEKGFVSVGTSVGLNLDNLPGIINGKGLSGGYRLSKRQTLGAYYVRNGLTFVDYQNASVGGAYSLKFSKFKLGVGYNRTDDTTGSFSNAANANLTFSLGKFQSMSLYGRYTIIDVNTTTFNKLLYGMTYSAHYLKNKAITGLNLSYTEGTNSLGLINTNNTQNYRAILSNSYLFKNKLKLRLLNNYSYFRFPDWTNALILQKNILFNNVLTFQLPPKSKVNYIPAVYLFYSDFNFEEMLSSGVQMNVNTSNFAEYFRLGFFVKGGYNKLLNKPELGVFFTGQANTVLSYRTWNIIARYNYGPSGRGNVEKLITGVGNQYPQNIGGSIANQYQFKNPHFILENTFNYNYVNVNKRHTLGLFTQLYYYTNGGWRFNLNYSFNYNVSENYKYVYNTGASNNFVIEQNGDKNRSKNFQLGAGVKKDFAIPIPKKFRKTRFCTSNFKAFIDVNGNKQFDANEIPLENIVIRLNDFEVLTNENGEGHFLNMKMGLYKLQVIPLVDIGAWFPVIPDSIDVCGPVVTYIPFSKGVEILGNVVIDREIFSAGLRDKLDISRIKIFLVDTLGNTVNAITDNRGNFKFYVPYGKYTLTFDERILGKNFELAENDIEIELGDGMESYYHTFFIIEKKRRVKNKKFNADGSVVETESEAGSAFGDGDNLDGSGNPNDHQTFGDDGNESSDEKGQDKSINRRGEGVENLKTFDSNKPDDGQQGSEASGETEEIAENEKEGEGSTGSGENVENLKTFTRPEKIIDKKSVEEINWAQMDSLIKVLIGKIKPGEEVSPEDLARIEESKITKSDLTKYADRTVYTIQIGAYKKGLPQKILTEVLRLGVKVESFKGDDGLTKYFTGYHSTYNAAMNARTGIEQRGLRGPFIISIHNGEIITMKELRIIWKARELE